MGSGEVMAGNPSTDVFLVSVWRERKCGTTSGRSIRSFPDEEERQINGMRIDFPGKK